MGTEVTEDDIANVQALCTQVPRYTCHERILMSPWQVISIAEYRATLFEYLKNRMNAIAPNLSVMVGELVGARLIAHAGR